MRDEVIARAAWALAAVAAALPLLSFLHQPAGGAPAAAVAALALAAVFRPHDALLVFAGLSPLATIIFLIAGSGLPRFHFLEALALALIAGWAANRSIRPYPLAVPAALLCSVTVLLSAALASAVVNGVRIIAEQPDARPLDLLASMIARDYLVSVGPLNLALQFAEGLVLVLLAADVCAGDRTRRERVLWMMAAGAGGAAVFNVLRITFIAVAREDPWQAFATYFATIRVNVHYGDLNAAGSYFAMMLPVAVSFTGRRALAVPCGVLLAAGVWLSGSRTALAAALLAGAVAGLLALRARTGRWRVPLVAVGLLLVLLAIGGWRWYPQGRNERAADALTFRILMAKTSLRLTADEPLFGVGLGRFYPLSAQYTYLQENAHNNYLQVMAELGVPGLLLFLAAIGLALREGWRDAGPPGPSWGLLAGISAYLLTCLGGHPLVTAAAAYPFWLALGLTVSRAAVMEYGHGRAVRRGAAALVAVLAVTAPFRAAAAAREANLEHTSIGFSTWQRQADGLRYRWAGGRSTFFVPATARAVRIPLKHGNEDPPALEVRVLLDGREANRVRLEAGGNWRVVRLLLTGRGGALYSRIDLEARRPGSTTPLARPPSHRGGALIVGRPEIEK